MSKHTYTMNASQLADAIKSDPELLRDIRDAGNIILMADTMFQDNFISLRQSLHKKRISQSTFKNIFKWQVAAAFRRSHATLALAAQYQDLCLS